MRDIIRKDVNEECAYSGYVQAGFARVMLVGR
jgi:hypothetical protein